MKMLLRTAAAAVVVSAAAAMAAPAVDGTVTLTGKPTRMTHAAAWLHDNAEGWYGKPLLSSSQTGR
ncbi:MAG: hypothetical protein ABIO71_11085 [Caldimonas sp.]